ncbi:MAG: hypothetical protein QF921_16600 [Pseudomonadales bacterium]|jgi:hypothetical protein|nr:hypothetical protein [Pseudomonadales bacterium]MDP6472729.1 hypothetical protein [Pseudomonadales bacterium]MDP6827942.1 hypothetical protein [Pseudomonadales bacterium]MDP6973105.1 hypothetical protein [Pseudomonadales bacterium]|tara:strand:- start:3373 stop:3570 length:198 start_codon:yes stop_codon:yes gene_type:complete
MIHSFRKILMPVMGVAIGAHALGQTSEHTQRTVEVDGRTAIDVTPDLATSPEAAEPLFTVLKSAP